MKQKRQHQLLAALSSQPIVKLVDATPRIADMLIAVALDERSKPYSRVAAADLIFRTIGTHLLEANQQEEINSIRSQLEELENGGPILDV